MKKWIKYVILVVIGLVIIIGLFYNLVIGTKPKEEEKPKKWYENELLADSVFGMRYIGKGCYSRYVYFYNNRAIVADWENTDEEPIILDIIYYKDKNTDPDKIRKYASNNTLVSNYYGADNNTDKTYEGLYQIIWEDSLLFLEASDTTVNDFLSTISSSDMFDCYG
ncbi:MAG: hypothetical protein IJ509_01545 [Bacilli bacterium]|nr:hypothetical protein [Bacilli bacterium]